MNHKRSPLGCSIEDFEFGDKIGHGGYAEVFKARSKNLGYENTYVAIKRISKNNKKFDGRNEVEIHSKLSQLSHPAVVKFYGSFEDKEYWYLILELCTGGTLEKYLKQKCRLSEEEAIYLIKQIIDGVQFLHFHLIIHRDLSLGNILLTDGHQVKIADFGLAVKLKHHDEKKYTVLGTANFMSPEVFNHDSYDFKTDCWSVGSVLYALLYGSPPFNGKKKEEIMRNAMHSQLLYPDYASSAAKEVLKALLHKDQKQRVSLRDALKFNFFNKFGQRNEYKCQKSGGDSGMGSGSKNSRSTSPKYGSEPNYQRLQKDGTNRKMQYKGQRSGEDCGLSSGTRNFRPTSPECGSGTNHYRLQKEKKNRHLKNASVIRSCDNLYDNTRFCSQNDLHSQKQRYEHTPYQDRYESQYETPRKNRPEYPADVQCFTEKISNIHLSYSDHNSNSFKNHSNQHRYNSQNHDACKQNRLVNDYNDGTEEDPSCSHNHHHFCSPSDTFNKENRNCLNVKNTVRKNLKDIVIDPLNTARLNPRRKEYEMKNVVVSILYDGQVSIECCKLKKGQKYVHLVYFISGNGIEIIIYKPKYKIPLDPDEPPPLPENEDELQYFNFETLPDVHKKKYQLAKCFVDAIRRQTVKITYHGEFGTCIMMENTPPNYEMNFYNGFQLTEIGHKKSFKDKNGIPITKTDDINFMLKEFAKLKEKCLLVEKNWETFHESNFPVIGGKKPHKKMLKHLPIISSYVLQLGSHQQSNFFIS